MNLNFWSNYIVFLTKILIQTSSVYNFGIEAMINDQYLSTIKLFLLRKEE